MNQSSIARPNLPNIYGRVLPTSGLREFIQTCQAPLKEPRLELGLFLSTLSTAGQAGGRYSRYSYLVIASTPKLPSMNCFAVAFNMVRPIELLAYANACFLDAPTCSASASQRRSN